MFSSLPDPDHQFFSLPQQHQRDLMWSIYGPALLDCNWSPKQTELVNKDPDWSFFAHQLQQPPEFRSPRLGLMFEQIWHRYLSSRHYRWQANLQIQNGKQTLGELDCLVQTATKTWHLEFALKFYLGYGPDWIGPNRRDYLADKITHTRDKQLPMATTVAAEKELAIQNWQIDQSLSIMRGCLFYPTDNQLTVDLPPEVSADHWRGYWVHQSQAEQFMPQGRWYLISKPQWLSPARVDFSIDRDTLLQHKRAHFQYVTTALCAVKVEQNRQGKWCEQQRWLIMPDSWPG